MKLSRLHWAGIVAVTAALVVMAPSDKDADIAKVARPAKQSSMRASSPSATEKKSRTTEVGRVELERLAGLESQQIDKKRVGDAFNITSWYVPPPAPRMTVKPVVVAPPPPPVPTAPPLPFTYLGRYGDTETRTIILSKGDRVYTVAVGEVIENTYRVEKFTPGVVHLTYLPLNIEQLLRTGETL
ncbi:MAG: hypothetical protein HOO95_06980 [Gallionella sp.]|nr:hypothetical protein [Gallionella sp.]